MTTDTQKQMIIEDLLEGRKITQLDATIHYGCSKLSTRCSELRRFKRWPIQGEMIEVNSRFGTKRVMQYSLIFLMLVLFTSCADVTTVDKCLTDEPYGFWSGLWHGLIVIFSWIGSWFSDDIAIYAINNNGGWYDFGYVLGLTGIFGALKSSSK